MNIIAILVANGFGIANMIMLLLSSKGTIEKKTFSDKIFISLIWVTIVLCAIEASTFLVDGKTFYGARALNIILNCLLFSINIVFVFLWTLYIDYKLFEDIERIKKRWWIIALPSFVVLAAVIVTPFYPIIFNVTADNVYQRTIYTYIPFIVSFCYLAYGEILIYSNRNNARSYMLAPSFIFLLPLIVGSVTQMFVYGVSLTWASLSISMVSLYINIHGNASHVDQLSGVYNRTYWEGDIKKMARKAKTNKKMLVGILIDVDNFKVINDKYGHQTGDEAIRNIGRILRNTASKNDFVARYGGDEFIIMREVDSEKDVVSFLDHLENNILNHTIDQKLPYKLDFSYGYSFYENDTDTVDSLFARMDKAMYESKRAKYGEDYERHVII
jgi:diguanylate cyclase (GGDEF)-like protein